ncbi:MAG: carboxypeptidase-like regulatory domain-containing protein, partial [Thermoguttaceae bacterium]
MIHYSLKSDADTSAAARRHVEKSRHMALDLPRAEVGKVGEFIQMVCATVRLGIPVAVLVLGLATPPWSACISPWHAAQAFGAADGQAVVDPKPAHPSRLPILRGIVLPGIASTENTTIAGQVVDAEGKPVSGASVAAVVDAERGAIDGRPLLLVVGSTDHEGRFYLTARPLSPPQDVNLKVYAFAPGYTVCWSHLDIYRSANHATLHLQPDQPIHGRVVDSQGKPVAGTEVTLFAVSLRSGVEGAQGGELRFPASPSAPKPVPVVTDEQGEFVLRGVCLEMANYRAQIRGQRHAMQQNEFKTIVNKPRKITITTKPPQTLEGTLIYGETKKPAVGVEVAVISWVLDGAFMNRGVVKGRTDLQGHFRLTPASGEFFSVGVLDTQSQFLHLLSLKPAEEVFNRKLDIVLPEGAAVRTTAEVDTKTSAASPIRGVSAESRGVTLLGRAVGPQGQAVANGFVVAATAFTHAGGWGHCFELPIRDGWFSVPGLRPGNSYEVYLCDVKNQWGATVIVSPDDPQPVSVRLAPCGAATARLLDGLGKPCANVLVSSPPSDLDLNFIMMLTSASPLAGRADLEKTPVAGSGFPCVHDPRYRELRTDANGQVTLPTLIPG